MEFLALAISLFSAGIAYLSFARATSRGVPVVELVCTSSRDEDPMEIRIHNPAPYIIVLERIAFNPHEAFNEAVLFRPVGVGRRGLIERELEAYDRASDGLHYVFVAVPPGETKAIYMFIVDEDCDGIDLRFYWTRSVTWLDRVFYPRRLRYSWDEIKSMRLASDLLTTSE